MFYVYEWYVKSTGEIFYVGKGSGDRYKVTNRNDLFKEKIQNNQCEVRIIKRFEDEQEAFQYESQRIKELKSINQCSCNIQEGGFGGMTTPWTQELKNEWSKNNIMKSESQKERMINNNPMHNPEIAKKVNAQKRKPVIINEIEYESIRAAADALNVATSTISSWCTTGKNSQGWICHYKGQNPQPYLAINTGKAKKIFYKGKEYPNASEAAAAAGVAKSTMTRWCRQQRDSQGNACYYLDDIRDLQETIAQRSQPFYVNNEYFTSKTSASKKLGISVYTLTSLLEGRIQDDKYICKYDNQQPSQENVE